MQILIIGGTRFLGRALVEAALAEGHEIILFNRGQSNPDLFPNIELLTGDRDGGLQILRGRHWDAVIDTCGYVPRLVRDSAGLLADSVESYIFISTISVYADPSKPGIDEQSPLGTMKDETIEEISGDTYGPLKVLCERAIDQEMNGRALHVRAGLLVGPYDQSDRFSYWPCRLAKGGEVLAPGNPLAPVQFIDVRDIAKWTIAAVMKGLSGPYNVTGPRQQMSMDHLLEACREASASNATLTWVSESFLSENNVAPFREMPLWVPSSERGLLQIDFSKAIQAGLNSRPLQDTVRDTLSWSKTRPTSYEWRAGLTARREDELLQLWHAG